MVEFKGFNLQKTNLKKSNLQGADLRKAHHLTFD